MRIAVCVKLKWCVDCHIISMSPKSVQHTVFCCLASFNGFQLIQHNYVSADSIVRFVNIFASDGAYRLHVEKLSAIYARRLFN